MRSIAFGHCDVSVQSTAQFDIFMKCANLWQIIVEMHLDAKPVKIIAKTGDVAAWTTTEIVPLLDDGSFRFCKHRSTTPGVMISKTTVSSAGSSPPCEWFSWPTFLF